MRRYRVELAGTLDGCETFDALHDAEWAAHKRAYRTGRLHLVWDVGAAMYVARVYPPHGTRPGWLDSE
jgi:hypothetical protein